MARTASLAHPIEPLPLSGGPLVDSPLTDDRLGFDVWLLPAETPNRTERAIRLCSTVAGPIAFVVTLACFVVWIA